MSRHHDLKTVQPFFDDVLAGRKTFEVRLNDRAFQAGDTVTLREYDPKAYRCKRLHDDERDSIEYESGDCQYSGRSKTFRIGYVLSASPVAPLGDYVVFSLAAEAEPAGATS